MERKNAKVIILLLIAVLLLGASVTLGAMNFITNLRLQETVKNNQANTREIVQFLNQVMQVGRQQTQQQGQ